MKGTQPNNQRLVASFSLLDVNHSFDRIMPVIREREITGWWAFLLAVVFKPTWELFTTSFVFLFLATATWIRDNFASEEWKRKLELKGFLPHIHPAWRLCIGLLVLLALVVRESHRLWKEQSDANVELRESGEPRVLLRIAGFDNRERDWKVMKNSGQITDSKLGSVIGFWLLIENVPPEGKLGAIAENVTAQVAFSADEKQLFVADGWWTEAIFEDREKSIHFIKQKDIGIGAREYLEIAFKFYYSPRGYALNDGSRAFSDWCNPDLELPEGSYSASVYLRGSNVNATIPVKFTNRGMSTVLHFDSVDLPLLGG